jgi:cytidine deaminase
MASDSIERAVALAESARESAYAPYSGFAVGAAVVTGSGELVAGANVENASYGLSICAERAAIVAAVAAGHRDFLAIAIAGPAGGATAPCGACRQFLSEFNPQMTIVYTAPEGVRTTTLDRLLPEAFGPKNLR